MKTILALLVLAVPCFGQTAYTGFSQIAGLVAHKNRPTARGIGAEASALSAVELTGAEGKAVILSAKLVRVELSGDVVSVRAEADSYRMGDGRGTGVVEFSLPLSAGKPLLTAREGKSMRVKGTIKACRWVAGPLAKDILVVLDGAELVR